MTTVAIPERIMIKKNVNKPHSSLCFLLATGPCLKKTVCPAAGASRVASVKSVTLRRLVLSRRSLRPPSVRGPIGSNRYNRLEAGPVCECNDEFVHAKLQDQRKFK